MHGKIDAAPCEIIAKGAGQIARKAQLRGLREMAGDWFGLVRGGKHPLPQGHKARTHGAEHRLQAFARRARLVIIDQRVIGIAALGKAVGF